MTEQPTPQRITIASIIRAVSSFYGIPEIDIKSDRRTRDTTHARYVAVWLARHLTTQSFTSIARAIGGRDHSTIIHGIQKMSAKIYGDEALRDEIASIQSEIVRTSGLALAQEPDSEQLAALGFALLAACRMTGAQDSPPTVGLPSPEPASAPAPAKDPAPIRKAAPDPEIPQPFKRRKWREIDENGFPLGFGGSI